MSIFERYVRPVFAPEDEAGAEGIVETPEVEKELERAVSVRSLLTNEFNKANAAPAEEPAATGDVPQGERARDPSTGKFVKADGTPAEAPAATPESKAKPEGEQPVETPSTASPSGPPVSWSQEAKQNWPTLPPAIQAAVLKREEEVSSGIAKYAEKSKAYDALESVIAPRRKYYEQSGRSDAELINQLWLWNEALLNNPKEAFPALAKLFGYDGSTQASTPQPEQPQIDPNLRAVLSPIQEQVTKVGGDLASLSKQLEAERKEKVNAEIAAWAKDKPHFERVRNLMGELMQSGRAADLDSAYQKACRLDDEVFQLQQQEATAKAAQQQTAKTAAQADAARKAAVSPAARAPSGNAASPAKSRGRSVRETLMEAVNDARA